MINSPDILLHILSYCDYTTNISLKQLNRFWYSFYHSYKHIIIYKQYHIHYSDVSTIYKNIDNDINKIIWIKGTKNCKYIHYINDTTDFECQTIPDFLLNHIYINSTLSFRFHNFTYFNFHFNNSLDILVNKLYNFYHILEHFHINLKLYNIRYSSIHRVDYTTSLKTYYHFHPFQYLFIQSLISLYDFFF